MLEVTHLSKQYQAKSSEPVGGVFDVDFAVVAGEIFTLLGPSGCGKTTTLRCIAGLEHPDSGLISLDGRVLFDGAKRLQVPMYDRDIGMVFQSYAIWPHMSVFENAAYPLRAMGRKKPSREVIKEKVGAVLKAVGLKDYQSRSATQLSGGQQQRLALARALVRQPKLLLLDEPLSNLDAQLREQMRGELKRIQADSGVTTVYVTHDQSEAMAISDRIAVLDKGRVIQIGSPEDIYDRPRSEFVANFIGRTNLFKGRLATDVAAGKSAVVICDFGQVVCRFNEARKAGQEAAFVIRPENVEVQAFGARLDGTNDFAGVISGRVYLGDVAEQTVELPGGGRVLARLHPVSAFRPGDRVALHFPTERTLAIG